MDKKKNFKFKNKDFGKKLFSDSKFSRPMQKAVEITIEEIPKDSKGKAFIFSGTIDRIVQTGGPTVFYITDGTGTLPLKAFGGAGIRSYPELVEGDAITATVELSEFRDETEGEVQSLKKLEGEDKKAFIKKLADIERKRASIIPPEFLVKSVILDKLRSRYIQAAEEIRLAIIQNRPVIVRHHNDADGYSSGYALERAILPLIEKQHGFGKSAWEFFSRAPCAAPFYEIDDSIRDTANSLRNVAKFSNKMPLIVIADNGSSPEDLMAIKQGKVHGMDFIVVDHHYFDEDVISSEVLVHINPFLVGEDGAKFSAGMLCVELARFINSDVRNVEQIAGMAGLADRIDNPDVIDSYLRIAKEKGYSKELLFEISAVIDFVSAKLRFMEAREYIEVLFGEPMKQQKALVALLAPHIRKLESKGLTIAKSTAEIEKIGKTSLQSIDIGKTFPGFGFYPKPGKCVGLIHDYARDEKKISNLVSIGIMDTAVTIRATDEANFSVHELIEFLDKKLPAAFVEGGGHKNAGSITFIPIKQQDVLRNLKEYIKSKQ
jgi:RecJ-like exonuclease